METSKPGNRPLVETSEPLGEIVSPESRAERLLAEYLRVWGLRDPQTIAALSRQWVRRASETASSPQQNATLAELYRAALRQATLDMQHWLDHLTSEVCAGSDDARSCRGLLAIEVQAIIDEFPAALLDEGSLPAALLEQLASAARPVVPASCPTPMPTQSLDALSLSSNLSRWRRVSNRLWRRMRNALSHQAGGLP